MTELALWQRIESRLDSARPGWRRRLDGFGQIAAVEARAAGRAWSDDEVFEALLMAALSSNTDWSKIERIQAELPELFSGFSLASYAERRPREIAERFVPWFQERRAGSQSQKESLVKLIDTARMLLAHSRVHGSAESYFTNLVQRCEGDPKRAALHLGLPGKYNKYKLPAFGVALAAEALKNLGFPVAKPDRHVGRAMGSFGLVQFERWPGRNGRKAPSLSSRKSLLAVMTAVQEIATAANTPVVLVDNAIWLLCERSGAKCGLYLTNPELAALARESGVAGGPAQVIGALIDSWAEREDYGEQRETFERLIEGLDRDRLSERKLFPEELKGRSW